MFLQDCNQLSDEQWVARALQSPDDFFCLVVKYEPALNRYIKKISGVSNEMAQDLTQEVFIKAYRHLNDFDLNLKFSSWIYRIAHNHTLNEVAKSRKFVFNPTDAIYHRISQELFENSEPDQSASNNLLQSHLTECVESLNDIQKSVILLYFWEDKSYEEISDILHLPLGTVGTHINRGKTKIRKCLRKYI